ncbi:15680_t:CDS:1, partial [Gigaspora rosea]
AQNWQLKHYLNYHLKNENSLTMVEGYEDWKRSLEIVKKVTGCISFFCHELLNIDNTFEVFYSKKFLPKDQQLEKAY